MGLFKVKYYYNFIGNLERHVHFFKSLQDVCEKNGINLILIVFLQYSRFKQQKVLVSRYRSSRFIIFFYLKRNIVALSYFFFTTLFSKKTTIHFKQTNPGSLIWLKKIFRKKLIFITSLEGDAISEFQYLSSVGYRNDRVNLSPIKNVDKLIEKEFQYLRQFDEIFVQNRYFKKLLVERHKNKLKSITVSHLMSFEKGKFSFDTNTRNKYREKLNWKDNYIVSYIGNVHYPWQNIAKTIRLFKLIKEELRRDAKLLLLINESDHDIALRFIDENKLSKGDYKLFQVVHDEVNGYLNASDVGVVIRDFHSMNRVVTSGKLLDYLASGLPVITTSVLTDISEEIRLNKFGVVLDTLDLSAISFDDFKPILVFDEDLRVRISKWANEKYSLDALSKPYLSYLKKNAE